MVEGQLLDHEAGLALFSFRVQHPVMRTLLEPTFNGEPLEHIARVRNRAWGQDTSIVSEYEVNDPGTIVLHSFLDLKGEPLTFTFGVQETESGILLLEETPVGVWFIDGDFIEVGPDGTRSILCRNYVPPPPEAEGQPFLSRLLSDGDDF